MADAFQVGGYLLLEGIRRDALTEEWVVRESEAKPLVQLVRLRPEVAGDEASWRAFVEHYEAVRDIDHPGVVRVIEVRRDEREVYGVLELVEGATLHELLASEGGREGLPEAVVLRMARDLASALAELHAAGITHGDVCPATVRITPGGFAMLAPGGLGVATCRMPRTAPATRLAYKSPEQCMNASSGLQSDVFGVAATLLEALTGRRVFEGEGEELAERVQRGRVAMRELGSAKSELTDVLASGLEVDPAARPGSVRALVRDMSAAAEVTPSTRFDVAGALERLVGSELGEVHSELKWLATESTRIPETSDGEASESASTASPQPRSPEAGDGRAPAQKPEPGRPSAASDAPLVVDPEQIPGLASGRVHKAAAVIGIVALGLVGFALLGSWLRSEPQGPSVMGTPNTPASDTRTMDEVPVPPEVADEPAESDEPDDEALPRAVTESKTPAPRLRPPRAAAEVKPTIAPPAPSASAAPSTTAAPPPRDEPVPPRQLPPEYSETVPPGQAPSADAIPRGI